MELGKISDDETLGKLAAEADSRLSFLKMLTPRSALRGARDKGVSKTFYFSGEKHDAKPEAGKAV